MNNNDYVYAFQPRSVDYPHFVAETREEVADMLGGFVGGEQCDGCGNSTYRIVVRTPAIDNVPASYGAQCAVDPDDDDEFKHPAPCGKVWQIFSQRADDTVF